MNKELKALEKICTQGCDARDELFYLKHKNCKETEENKKHYPYCNGCVFCSGSEEYKIIESALKNYEELTNKPVILYGRTNGHTQALIDMICKNYKEVKITNLEDEKKVKAFEIIKEKMVNVKAFLRCCNDKAGLLIYNSQVLENQELTQEEYDLLKEVLL